MSMFDRICWDTVSTDCDIEISPTLRCLHAIWPSPVDSDACFNAAGFAEFADSDDAWDAEWKSLVFAAVTHLSRIGRPMIRKSLKLVVENPLWNRILTGNPRFKDVNLTLTEQIVLASQDDQFGGAVIDFGVKPDITLAVGDGHPILWVFDDGSDKQPISKLGREISAGLEFSRQRLNWSHLSPPKVQE